MPPIILFHGPDAAPAQALAQACAVPDGAQPYAPAALDHGRDCILVWTDPASTLAHCLRNSGDVTKACADWMRFADDILARAEVNAKAGLVLVESQAICAADPSPLAMALPLVRPLPPLAPAPPRDNASVLTILMLPHLPGLQQTWQRLRAISLCTDAAPLALSELVSLASRGHDLNGTGGATDDLRALVNGELAMNDPPFPAALTEELSLLREHLTYLQTELGLGHVTQPATGIEPATGPLESAIAALLADLVTETDRRILAEREAQLAQATLRGLGLDANSQPYRSPAAPRRAP